MGNIARLPQNLLAYYKDLSNAYWTPSQASVERSVILDPHGFPDGDKLIDTVPNAQHYIRRDFTGLIGDMCLAIDAKRADLDWMYLQIYDSTDAYFIARTWFNLNTGALGTTTFGNAGIETRGNGWYRPYVYGPVLNSNNTIQFFAILASADNTGTYAGTGTDGTYMTNPIINKGTRPDDFDKIPILSDVNLLTAPNDFTDAAWTATGGVTVTPNDTDDPNGQPLADRITSDGSAVGRCMYQAINETGDGQYCAIVKVKEGTLPAMSVAVYDDGAAAWRMRADFQWAAGVLGLSTLDVGVAAGSVDIGGGWYLVWVTGAGIVAANVNRILLYCGEHDQQPAGYHYLWGAKCFRGNGPTRVIGSEVPRT